jgi:hypothetical protein
MNNYLRLWKLAPPFPCLLGESNPSKKSAQSKRRVGGTRLPVSLRSLARAGGGKFAGVGPPLLQVQRTPGGVMCDEHLRCPEFRVSVWLTAGGDYCSQMEQCIGTGIMAVPGKK